MHADRSQHPPDPSDCSHLSQLAVTIDRRLALLDKHARVRVRAWLKKLREEVRGAHCAVQTVHTANVTCCCCTF